MSDASFDDLSRAAGEGMPRRKLLRLLLLGGAATAAAGAGIKAAGQQPAGATALNSGSPAGPGAARPQVGGICAILLNLAGSFSGVPFVGGILTGIAGALGCPLSGDTGGSTTTTTSPICPLPAERDAADSAAAANDGAEDRGVFSCTCSPARPTAPPAACNEANSGATVARTTTARCTRCFITCGAGSCTRTVDYQCTLTPIGFRWVVGADKTTEC